MPDKATLEFIGKTVAVLAFLFTALSYGNNLRLSQNAARYAEARALMVQYREGGVRAAEHALYARSLYYRVDGLDPNQAEDYPDAIYEEIAKEVLFGATDSSEAQSPPLLPRLLDIADFYAEVTFCLTQSICDQTIAQQYFCPRVAEFHASNARLFDFYSDYAQSKEWNDGVFTLLAQCDG